MALVIVLSKIPLTIYLLLSVSLILLQSVVDIASLSLGLVCTVFPLISICCRVDIPPPASIVNPPAALDVGAVDFPSLVELQSRTLHQLLSQSAAGPSSPSVSSRLGLLFGT